MIAGIRLAVAMLIAVLSGVAHAADNPLRPSDTSSPRATLQGFMATTDDIYSRLLAVLLSYDRSDRLYLTAQERHDQLAGLREGLKVVSYLDLSGIAPVLRDTLAAERTIQLKEILDRIDLPALADVPDRDAMASQPVKRWRLPNTEIDIVLVENGPRAGEYLFSSATIDRLPEFYEQVKKLPYRPGPAQQLSDVYRRISGGGTATIYDAFVSSPIGLSRIIPPRWMLSLPTWARTRIAGASPWQWVGLATGLAIGALIVLAAQRIARRRNGQVRSWRAVPVPLAIIVVAGIVIPLADALLRIGGYPRVVMEYAATTLMYLGGAWLTMVASMLIGELIVSSERLTSSSLDSQLIRLGTRLAGVAVAIAIIIQLGDELGFPTYSILAGLGVGGLAVALAARDTIANLIGSLLITLEKPFRVGHVVRIGGSEGTVEDVGFRSTRIRTPDNSLVSIPSSAVVNTTVENLSLRPKRRQRFFVQVTYDTPRDKVEQVVSGIRQLLTGNQAVEPGSCRVHLNNFAESSLDILVIFHLQVDDYATELQERETILLRIMDLLQEAGVELAFPTRTLNIAGAAGSAERASGDARVLGFTGRT